MRQVTWKGLERTGRGLGLSSWQRRLDRAGPGKAGVGGRAAGGSVRPGSGQRAALCGGHPQARASSLPPPTSCQPACGHSQTQALSWDMGELERGLCRGHLLGISPERRVPEPSHSRPRPEASACRGRHTAREGTAHSGHPHRLSQQGVKPFLKNPAVPRKSAEWPFCTAPGVPGAPLAF